MGAWVCLPGVCEKVSHLSPCPSFWLIDYWSVSRVVGELEISGSSDLAAPVVDHQGPRLGTWVQLRSGLGVVRLTLDRDHGSVCIQTQFLTDCVTRVRVLGITEQRLVSLFWVPWGYLSSERNPTMPPCGPWAEKCLHLCALMCT